MILGVNSKRHYSSYDILLADQLGDSAYLYLSNRNLFLSQFYEIRLFVYQIASLDIIKVHEVACIYRLIFRFL
jgi:hypothetical protein